LEVNANKLAPPFSFWTFPSVYGILNFDLTSLQAQRPEHVERAGG
jgi:hypothetical protein